MRCSDLKFRFVVFAGTGPQQHSKARVQSFLRKTPHKTEFGLDQRAYSAGCIRIDKPYKLAKRLLNGPEEWTMGRIWDIVDSGKTQTVFLPEPVPVLITYLTAQVDDQGQVQFRKDVYKRDAALL